MYLKYFGLAEAPFSIAPDPRYLYMSTRHQEALAHLLYGLQGDGGFVLLTGEVGAGKTTICRCLLEQVPDTCDVAYIFNPKLTAEELLSTLCVEFGIAYPPGNTSIKVFIDCLNAYLLDAHARGRHTVLIIDEAQNLSVDVLEQMRLLTNLETNQRKLLQIILLGQPELATMLEKPELRQLAQRIVARYHLGPLNKAEVAAYLRYRLEVSGIAARNRQLFPDSLVPAIYGLTGGIPRLVNVLCDRALLGAYAQGKESVDRATLRRAALEVFPGISTKRGNGRHLFLTLALGLALVLVAALLYFRHEPPLTEILATGSTAAQSATPPGPAAKPQDVLVWPANEARSESQQKAYAALFKAWGSDYQGSGSCREVLRENLNCRSARGNLMELRQMNRPAVLSLHDADNPGQAFYATLIKLDKDQASFAVGATVQTVALAALADQWTGQYFMLWRKPPEADTVIRLGARGPAVAWLSRQLALAEGRQADAGQDPLFDEAMARHIRHFQLSQDLDPDGEVGSKTLMRLAGISDEKAPKLTEGKRK